MPTSLERVEAIEQPIQFPRTQFHNFGLGFWPGETVLFQSLLPEAESVAIPVENLDNGTPSVAEGEQMAGEHIVTEAVGDHQGKTVDSLAHVGGTKHQPYPGLSAQEVHASRPSTRRIFSNVSGWKLSGISMRTPFQA